MNLNDFAGELVAKNFFVKASFGGFAGSGKTKTASDFVVGAYHDMKLTKPVLIIDNEKGSRFLVPKFKAAGIEARVKDTMELADVLKAMEFLRNGDVSFVLIDSLSKVWYKYVRDYKAKKSSRYAFMTLEDWGKILPAWQESFSDVFVDCPGNIVFTGRGGFSYEKEEDVKDENGNVTKKGAMVKSGVKMKLAGETPFEPDLNVWMEMEQDLVDGQLKVWREAQVLKDRNDTATSIDGKVFRNPTYEAFRPVVKFLMGVPVGVVNGASDTTNLAPSEDFGYMQRKRDRDIQVEKIKAAFDKAAFGSTNAEKQLKVVILEKCFGSASSTEIEKMDAEKLAEGRVRLEYIFAHWNDEPNRLEFVQNVDLTKIDGGLDGAFK